MSLPNECSLECEICGVYNISEGIISDGKIYCWGCIKKPDFKKILKKYKGNKNNGRRS